MTIDQRAIKALGEEALASFDYAAFESYINSLGIKHFAPYEFLFLGESNKKGKCQDKNTLPPPILWNNIGNTARMLDHIRAELGAPITILSAYRSPAYNKCIGGEHNSYHTRFNAIDWRAETGKVSDWHAAAKSVRRRYAEFRGGIGYYPRQGFIHIDTRGANADW